MTTPKIAGGLPELPEPNVTDGNNKAAPELGRSCSGYDADQMRAYGEQCRAASGDYRWLEELRERMEHSVSAADEGEDYSVPREMLDAMTTLGLMGKVGRGRWAPTEAGREFAERKPTLPVVIYGKCYEVPIRVQLHIVNLEEKLRALSRGVPEGMVLVPVEPTPEMMKAIQTRSEVGAHICGSWTGAYGCIQELWDVAIAAQRKEGE